MLDRQALTAVLLGVGISDTGRIALLIVHFEVFNQHFAFFSQPFEVLRKLLVQILRAEVLFPTFQSIEHHVWQAWIFALNLVNQGAEFNNVVG